MPIKNYGSHKVCINNYTIRMETHQSRPHIVVPIVMMIPGVHAGSHGPLLHSEEALSKFPASWNGIPITISHPKEDGHPVSANSPEIIDTKTVGRIYNADFVGNKLRAEAWLDEQRLQQVSLATLEALRQGRILEVSVGVFTEDEDIAGYWNGKQYAGIARNHRPDHCAILDLTTGEIGACAVVDGCGVRTNEKGGAMADVSEAKVKVQDVFKELALAGFSVNQLSYGDISQKIQAKLDRMDDDTKVHYLEETYPGFFIYRVRPRGGDAPMNPDGEMLFKRNYTSQGDNSIEFTGEALPVVKKVDYVTANKEKGATIMSKDGKGPCCPEKVEALIANTETKWTPDDREVLLTMSAEQLEKLAPVEVKVEVPAKAPIAPVVMSKEQAVQVLKEELGDQDKFLSLLPAETRASVQHGLGLYKAQRAQMIEKITTASPDVYTADELNAMSMDALEKVARIAKIQTDFTPLGGGNVNIGTNEGGTLLPQGVE